MIDRMETGKTVDFGPLSPEFCRSAQRINDAIRQSAAEGTEITL
jgi:hypothetical protein